MQGVDCVSEGDLRAFLLGDLPGPIADMVAHHLDQCRDCEQAARRLDDLTDPIIHTLRRAVGGDLTASGVGADTPTGQDAPLPPEKSPAGPPGYEIVGELGRGGMSVVYQARQRHPQRTVALKMILAAAHAGASRRARFLAEADAIARLQHPNIVTVYEVGEHDGLPYLSLEYIAGGTLADRLAGVPQPPRAAAALVVSLAGAVQYAHDHGVVHRDLKPSNVLLASTSIPKITDFGLAKQAELALTATGDILGTPQYMAPEQAGGKRTVGPSAGIYALGAILYECLTGRPPFRGATVLETMNQVQSLPPVSPRQLQPKVPRDLETICLKCLEKEPARRYASAAALADDLGRFQAGAPVMGRRAGGAERAWRWCHRNPAVAGLVASIAALLIVIAVVASTAAIRLTGALADSEGQRHRAETAETDLTRSLGDLTAEKRGRTEELFHAYAATARAKRFSGQPGRRFETLAAAAEAARLARELGLPREAVADVRTDAIAALALPDLSREWSGRLPATNHTFNVWGTFAPDLARHVVVEGGAVVVYGADARPIRRLTADRHVNDLVYFSPDGRHVTAALAGAPPETAVWDLDDPRPEPRTVLAGYCPLPSFRPDGRQIALAADGAAVVYDLDTGREVGRVGHDTTFRDCVPDPTGRRLAATEQRPAEAGDLVHVFDLATGAEDPPWPLPPSTLVGEPVWNVDGTLLAVGAGRNVHVWEFGDGPPHAVSVLERHQNSAVRAAFVPGTDLLVSSSWDMVTRVWDPVSGRQLMTLPGHVGGVSADGRVAIADATGGYAVWRLDPAVECRLLHHGRAGNRTGEVNWVFSAPFAPDGRLLATMSVGGARFWDAATGAEVGPMLPVGAGTALFLPGSGDLVTATDRQALRWPRSDRGGTAMFGPPQWLADGPLDNEAAPVVSADGGWLAYAVRDAAYVVRTDDPTRRVVLGPHPGLRFLSLGPDGRRVVSGTWGGRNVLVRDIQTGQVVRQIDGTRGRGWLSPDGRRLATILSPEAVRLWDAATAAPVTTPSPVAGHAGAFTPDGRRFAANASVGVVRLLDAADGRPLADLELPVSAGVMSLAFSPAGDKLAVGTQEQLAAVWDLAAVRRTLDRIGLDWDDGPVPPPPPAGPLPLVELVGAAARRRPRRPPPGRDGPARPGPVDEPIRRGGILRARPVTLGGRPGGGGPRALLRRSGPAAGSAGRAADAVPGCRRPRPLGRGPGRRGRPSRPLAGRRVDPLPAGGGAARPGAVRRGGRGFRPAASAVPPRR